MIVPEWDDIINNVAPIVPDIWRDERTIALVRRYYLPLAARMRAGELRHRLETMFSTTIESSRFTKACRRILAKYGELTEGDDRE